MGFSLPARPVPTMTLTQILGVNIGPTSCFPNTDQVRTKTRASGEQATGVKHCSCFLSVSSIAPLTACGPDPPSRLRVLETLRLTNSGIRKTSAIDGGPREKWTSIDPSMFESFMKSQMNRTRQASHSLHVLPGTLTHSLTHTFVLWRASMTLRPEGLE